MARASSSDAPSRRATRGVVAQALERAADLSLQLRDVGGATAVEFDASHVRGDVDQFGREALAVHAYRAGRDLARDHPEPVLRLLVTLMTRPGPDGGPDDDDDEQHLDHKTGDRRRGRPA